MKRTPEEVVKDAEKIMNVLERACSIEELERQTGLNFGKIRYSLKKVGKGAELTKKIKENNHGIKTLFNTQEKNGDLIFTIKNMNHSYTELVKKENNFIYTNGEHTLSIGDEVFTACKSKGKIILLHYEVISLDTSKNVRVKYTKKIGENISIEELHQKVKSFYRVFARDAIFFFDEMEECLAFV